MTSREILDFINAPKEIKNIEDLQKIVSSSTNLTLIEYVFFQNFEMVVKDILVNRIKGDIVNIGVYKGGGSLYMKSRFEESGVSRKWYLFDSFKGFNESKLMNMKDLNALNFFKENIDFSYDFPSSKYVLNLFERFFLDKNLFIIDDFIENSYNKIQIDELAMLHIDVDFYQPTFFSLEKFYPKVIDGGWIIIDDYNVEIFDCKKAVDEFRTINNISDKLIKLGNYQVGWKKKHLNVLY